MLADIVVATEVPRQLLNAKQKPSAYQLKLKLWKVIHPDIYVGIYAPPLNLVIDNWDLNHPYENSKFSDFENQVAHFLAT